MTKKHTASKQSTDQARVWLVRSFTKFEHRLSSLAILLDNARAAGEAAERQRCTKIASEMPVSVGKYGSEVNEGVDARSAIVAAIRAGKGGAE